MNAAGPPTPTWRLKGLVALGIIALPVGLLILVWLVRWGEDWLDWAMVGGWGASVGLGGFLLWQWVQLLRGRRTQMGIFRLWRVSTLFWVYLASVVLWFFAVDQCTQGCVRFVAPQQVSVLLPAFLTYPLSGLWLAVTLWRHALRP